MGMWACGSDNGIFQLRDNKDHILCLAHLVFLLSHPTAGVKVGAQCPAASPVATSRQHLADGSPWPGSASPRPS